MSRCFWKEIAEFRALQHALETLSDTSNLQLIARSLPELKPKHVFRGVFEAAHYRPKHIQAMAEFLSVYSKEIVGGNGQGAFRRHVLDCVFEILRKGQIFPSKANLMNLLYGLVANNVVSAREFVLELTKNENCLTPIARIWTFCFFAPEIEELDQELYERLFNLIVNMASNSFLPVPFRDFLDLFEQLRKDEWKELRERRDQRGYSLEIALKNDDLQALMKMSSVVDFDFGQKIHLSVFQESGLLFELSPSLLEYAAFYGSIDCFKFLLLNLERLPCVERLPRFAVAGGDNEIVRIAAQRGASYVFALDTAVEFHRHDLLMWIRETVLTPVSEGNPLVSKAVVTSAQSNNIDAICYFHKRKADGGAFERALHTASQYNSLEIAKFLLSLKDVNPLAKNDLGLTPLHQAAVSGAADMVKVFLKVGNLQFDVKDDTGETPYSLALLNQRTKIASLLKRKKLSASQALAASCHHIVSALRRRNVYQI